MPALAADARIGEIALTVTSLERSLPFYTETLGFVADEERSGVVALRSAPGKVLVRLREDRSAGRRARRTSGLFHFAILVPDRAALGRSLRRLGERQWPLTGASDHLVSEALYLDDPDGLGIEIYRDRPPTAWAEWEGEVVMATDPLDVDALAREPGADEPWTGLAPATVIGHVHLHVPNLDAAEAFYCGEVGFEPRLRRYPGALFVAAGGYHHHLGLNIWAGRGAPPPAPGTVGLESFTIRSSAPEPRQWRDDSTGVTVRCLPVA